jgi:hypothetical protein
MRDGNRDGRRYVGDRKRQRPARSCKLQFFVCLVVLPVDAKIDLRVNTIHEDGSTRFVTLVLQFDLGNPKNSRSPFSPN